MIIYIHVERFCGSLYVSVRDEAGRPVRRYQVADTPRGHQRLHEEAREDGLDLDLLDEAIEAS